MENNNQQYQDQPNYGQQPGTPNLAKPDSNLVWGILVTVLCCWPLGAVSIFKASKVDSLWYAGRYQEAYDASKSAKNWALASIAGAVLIFIFYFVLGFMSAL